MGVEVLAMTKHESQALAARLERVWGATRKEIRIDGDHLGISLVVVEGVEVWYAQRVGDPDFGMTIAQMDGPSHRRGQLEIGWSSYTEVSSSSHWHDEDPDEFAQFAAQWLPFFRRGVWLSGANIEATAHEKIEWIRGFTQEELNAWQLTF